MTFSIAKLFRITIATLAIFPLALTLNITSARAESLSGEIKAVSERIAKRNLIRPAPVTESLADNLVDSAKRTLREQSNHYLTFLGSMNYSRKLVISSPQKST